MKRREEEERKRREEEERKRREEARKLRDSRDVREWSVEEVCSFIEEKGFGGDVKTLFFENEINGEAFVSLSTEDLEKMGIKKIGVLKNLISLIMKMKNASPVLGVKEEDRKKTNKSESKEELKPNIMKEELKDGKEIGRGGFGVVLAGEYLGTPVAIKRITLKAGENISAGIMNEFNVLM